MNRLRLLALMLCAACDGDDAVAPVRFVVCDQRPDTLPLVVGADTLYEEVLVCQRPTP